MHSFILVVSLIMTSQAFAERIINYRQPEKLVLTVEDVTDQYTNLKKIDLRELTDANKQIVRSSVGKALPKSLAGKSPLAAKPSAASAAPLAGATMMPELDQAELVVDKVINIGTKIWKVIEKGTPILTYSQTTGSAVPKNTKNWTDLENYKEPQTRVMKVSYKNIFGEVVHFVYRVILVAGGSYHGVGSYIGYAAVEPIEMTPSYLYKLTATATVDTVFNKGTSANPVAGMVLTVRWSVSTVTTPLIGSHTFFLDGNGAINVADEAGLVSFSNRGSK